MQPTTLTLNEYKFDSGTWFAEALHGPYCNFHVACAHPENWFERAIIGRGYTLDWIQDYPGYGCIWRHEGTSSVGIGTTVCTDPGEWTETWFARMDEINIFPYITCVDGVFWVRAILHCRTAWFNATASLVDIRERNACKPGAPFDEFGVEYGWDVLGKFGTKRAVCAALNDWIRNGIGWQWIGGYLSGQDLWNGTVT